eukprot:6738572-Alexandrium_andersonii.AAC.1
MLDPVGPTMRKKPATNATDASLDIFSSSNEEEDTRRVIKKPSLGKHSRSTESTVNDQAPPAQKKKLRLKSKTTTDASTFVG